MVRLSNAIENVLNEARMLLLGGQVLLGFSYRISFESRFEQLPSSAQLAEIAGLGIMTAGLGWLIWPAAFHQIKEKGRESAAIHALTTTVLDWALLPLAAGLSLTIYPVLVALQVPRALLIAVLAGAFALALWYGWSCMVGDREKRKRVQRNLAGQEKQGEREHPPDISDQIKKVLIECRMALPGAQAFLGFQFAIVFAQGFERIPRSWQIVHFVSLLATTISIVLLIAPAAYHRLAEAGEDTEHFRRVASRLLLAGLVFLGPGMAGDLFLVIAKVTGSPTEAGLTAGLLLLAFYGLWFGVSAWRTK
jgi:hypothetical protein